MAEARRVAIQQAFALRRANRLDEAAAAFAALLAAVPGDPEALHGMSLVAQATGRLAEAIGWARQAVQAAPRHPGLHYTLGLMLDENGETAAASSAFAEATRLKPDFLPAWNNLGLSLEALARPDAAMQAYDSALVVDPGYAPARSNRGALRLGRGDAAGALADFRQLIAAAPREAGLRLKEAQALIALQRLDEGRAALAAWLAARPDDAQGIALMANTCAAMNDTAAAIDWWQRLLAIEPGDWRARIESRLALPVIHASAAALAAARQRYADGLVELLGLAESPPGTPAQRLHGIERENFFLAYQGEDDRSLQADYARLLRRLLPPSLPERSPAAAVGGAARRPRIGFASCFFRDCTVGHYFRAWIVDLDPGRFEKFIYHLARREDALSEEFRRHADHFRRPQGDLAAVAATILADQLDVLIYPELGMNGRSFALAALRLAPLQCAGWGHPVTSGHASIDVYFSSQLMEPADGETHYTERLVRLPGLGTCYRRAAVAGRRRRSDFDLPEDAHLYFFPHALFKIHPENDATLARILAADPAGRLVLCAAENRWVTQAFVDRLQSVLADHGVDGVDGGRLQVLPPLPRPDYLEVNRLCDVMLDATRWSGGNTSLDALAAGLPIVSRWGRFMRGRQSAGMLSRLGVPELIANDEAAYVKLALRLGSDRAWRDELSARIVAGGDRLFDDAAPVAALEAFLLAATAAVRE